MNLAQILRVHCAPPQKLLLVGVLFCTMALVGLAISQVATEHIASIWLANGIVIAFVLVAPRRHWLSYLITIFIANMLVNWALRENWLFGFFLAWVNLAEILAAVVPLRARLGRAPALDKPENFITFLLFGVMFAPAVSATLAALTVYGFFGNSPLATFANWYAADALDIGIVTPAVLLVLRGEARPLFSGDQAEKTLLWLAGFAVLVTVIFAQTRYPLLFVIPPTMLLLASILGHGGVALSVPILTLIGLTLSIAGHGPIAINPEMSIKERLMLTQVFIYSASLLAFWMANKETDRRRVADALKESVEKLAQLAAVDGLTGLTNRRSFDDALCREWSRAARSRLPLSLVLIDVDHFKAYNDLYGHLAGDDCLRLVAGALGYAGKRPGDLPARFGGEEFALILPETSKEGADLVAEALRVAIEKLHIPHGGSQPLGIVTASFGAATVYPASPSTMKSPKDLISAADRYLYDAKARGRNIVLSESIVQRMHREEPWRLAAAG